MQPPEFNSATSPASTDMPMSSNARVDSQTKSESQPETSQPKPSTASTNSLITIFALPKPFGGDTDLIQKNAIRSWARLQPHVEVLLIGDEEGIADAADELGVRHAGGVQFNEHGTPLVSSAFEIAHRESDSPFLAYCNCDVILMKDFVRAIEILASDSSLEQFVAFGQRTDLKIEREIRFDQLMQIEQLLDDCQKNGVLSSNVCKEYFVFQRELYFEVPPFAIGRGNWDNWMIHSAKEKGFPAVKISDLVTAIHQAHDYRHTGAGRFKCYVSGDEARENLRLAGGRNLISGSTATHRLTENGLAREPMLVFNPAFWADVPRFVRLMLNMLLG
ncbi:MAG: hypothetical protein AB8B55_14965 [Mariniblastus sp.]